MSVQDPTDHTWYMDAGATNHIATQPGTLRPIFNKSHLSSVTIGNGSCALVTQTGHTTFSSQSRPLHLCNVLVFKSIIKNLVSVWHFFTDNMCSVEFDLFGFRIKDLQTWSKLL